MELPLVSETTWSRIEGSPRDEDSERALAAKLSGGPLWMLAQQWRMGELLGDDAASPISTSVSWRSRPIGVPDGPRGPTDLLEATLEAEPWVVDLRLRAQAGIELAELVDVTTYVACLEAFPLPALPPADAFPASRATPLADASTRAFHRAIAGRVADGYSILLAAGRGELAAPLDTPTVRAALDELAVWLDRTYPHRPAPDESHWVPSELEYRATVQVGGSGAPTTLAIDDHQGGRVDWWSFDLVEPTDWTSEEPRTEEMVPTTIEFPGMPLSRYWQFEEPHVDFGRVSAATTDLARMMLTEFVLIYGEDWFSVPIDVERGSLVRIDDLVVTNTYGERFVIRPSGAPSDLSWDRWSTGHPASPREASVPDERDRLIVFAPVALSAISGPAIEEIVLARDEAANVLWGIELSAVNGLGEATELLGYWGDHLLGSPNPPQGPGLHYTLITDVPATWIPFTPRLDRGVTPPRASALELIPFVRTGADGTPIVVRPLGALLNKEDPPGTYRLAEESVNRVAQRIIRRFERARSGDGRVHIWVANARTPSQPDAQSGLRMDVLTDIPS